MRILRIIMLSIAKMLQKVSIEIFFEMVKDATMTSN